MKIDPTLELVCKLCGWKPDRTLTMGDVKRHMVDSHHVEDVDLDLSAICTCGKEMRPAFTEPDQRGEGFIDHFKCDQCGNVGVILRGKDKAG